MRCDVVRRMIEEEPERPPEVQAHLASCPGCAEYIRQWEFLRAGFAALQKEEPPEPSLGFAQRVARKVQEARDSEATGLQFIVQAGRRMVYATLLVAVMLILGLVLPSSGPLRAPQSAAPVLAAPQLTALSSDQVMGIDDESAALPVAAGKSQPGGQESR